MALALHYQRIDNHTTIVHDDEALDSIAYVELWIYGVKAHIYVGGEIGFHAERVKTKAKNHA